LLDPLPEQVRQLELHGSQVLVEVFPKLVDEQEPTHKLDSKNLPVLQEVQLVLDDEQF
jgi:hypothetical protein